MSNWKNSFVWACLTLLVLQGGNQTTLAQRLAFRIEAEKETTLVYESIFIRYLVRNEAGQPLALRACRSRPKFEIHRIVDVHSGEELPICGLDLFRMGALAKKVSFQPGDERFGSLNVFRGGTCYRDSATRFPYLPASRYRIVCSFCCELDSGGGDTLVNRLHLLDSVVVVVSEATGRDLSALKELLAAGRKYFNADVRTSMEAYWRLISEYPESPYAGEALEILVHHIESDARSLPPSIGITKEELYRKFLFVRPNSVRCRYYLPSVLERSGKETRIRLLNELSEAVPGSFVDKLAKEALVEEKGRK